jgi:CheY-like chemotaxis protein
LIRAAEEDYRKIPILAISANGECTIFIMQENEHETEPTALAMAGDREKCLTAKMDDYVSKPLTIPQLGAALNRMLQRLGRST